MLALIQQIVLVVGTLAGAITDATTGYIYDWITIPMILLGLILSISQGQINNIIYAAILFAVLFIAYKFGKIGGGDVKLFAAICLLNPYNDLNFLATTIFSAALLSMVFYSVFYVVKYARQGISIEKNKPTIFKALALGALLTIYLAALVLYRFLPSTTAILIGIIFYIGLTFFAFQGEIKKSFFEKKVKIKELEEDEIVSTNNSKTILSLLKGKELLEPNDVALLKKHSVREIIVMRNLPQFGPFICIGTIIGIAVPHLFFILLF